jgi:5-methylthioadenosine/S-adenosylhomocysteine deaminase
MDMTAKLHKVDTLDPTAADAEAVLYLATQGGADAIGLGKEIGSLAPGKKADIIILDAQQPHLVPLYHPVSHIVYAARGGDVDTVIIDGRPVMEARRLSTMDVESIMSAANELSKEIKRQ